jgi:hypothetical protein
MCLELANLIISFSTKKAAFVCVSEVLMSVKTFFTVPGDLLKWGQGLPLWGELNESEQDASN